MNTELIRTDPQVKNVPTVGASGRSAFPTWINEEDQILCSQEGSVWISSMARI